MAEDPAILRRFQAALAEVIPPLQQDRAILAAILCGSLAHDRVWAGSDIDLVLVTVDDPKAPERAVALVAQDVNIHACMMPRTRFRQLVEGAVRNSFMHSFLAKGRLLFTKDPTLADLHASMAAIGERDTELQLFAAATCAIPLLHKARKFYHTRHDLPYTALWLIQAAVPLARLEILGRRQLADREVLPQALTLNPDFFRVVYTDLLSGPTDRKVTRALAAAEAYLDARLATAFAPLIAYLAETGDVRGAAEIEQHFQRNFDLEGVVTACEYLADKGLLVKAATPAKLTRISSLSVQELAFYAPGPPPDQS